MLGGLKRTAKNAVRAIGFDVIRYQPPSPSGDFPQDFTEEEIALCLKVKPYTMSGYVGIQVTCAAVEYVVKNDIPGALVECGVWRGGSMMAAAYTLLRLGDTRRDLFLFDTFEGMPEPAEVDANYWGGHASDYLAENRSVGKKWLHASLEDVTNALYSVGYDKDRIHFVKGSVEDTIPSEAPEAISFLRLDTCFFASTHHELVHLFPRLASKGILLVDDYGVWKGARRATDEYIAQNGLKLFLCRVDYHGDRVAVKL